MSRGIVTAIDTSVMHGSSLEEAVAAIAEAVAVWLHLGARGLDARPSPDKMFAITGQHEQAADRHTARIGAANP